MTYRTPPERQGAVREVLRALDEAERVVLTTHLNADGDGTGCEIALASWLSRRGKAAWILNPTPFPDLYRFLLPDPTWVVEAAETERAAQIVEEADLGIVVDTGEQARLGRVKPLFDEVSKVVVDHHPPGEDAIPGVSFREPSAAAAGELVYDLLIAGDEELDLAERNALYVAIMTDTGSFRFSNSTPGVFRMAADLVEAGVQPDVLHERVYGSHPLRRLRLLRETLDTIDADPDGLVAWMTVPREAYDALDASPDDLDGFVDYPRMVEGVEIGILFRPLADGSTKISFRSTGNADVNELARLFGGGGHARAAGARVSAAPEEARVEVLARAIERAKRARNQGGADGVD